MSNHLSDYDYDLPEAQIAKYPPPVRSASRLLVVHRDTKTFEDRMFPHLLTYLRPGDCLVLNETRVIPARLFGTRRATGAAIEMLLHQRLQSADEEWKVLVRPAKKVKVGEWIDFDGFSCSVLIALEAGERVVRFDCTSEHFQTVLDKIGKVPLPPYMNRDAEALDRERYQTVYAHNPGAVAAPTAGLHFTNELLSEIEASGVGIARITLHTGLGTFRPVEVEDITDHTMHEEIYEVPQSAAECINRAREAGNRVIAVGTTSVRTLETVTVNHVTAAERGSTSIFIHPPYEYKGVDAIVTNFHMPRSTLMMMISAFAGREFILDAYHHAVENGYRFFSYGDAMLIL